MDREKLYKDLRDVLSKITLLLKTLEGMQTPKADARFARAHSDELAGDVRAVEEDIKAHNTESLAWRVNELALDVRAEAARQEQAARTIDAQLPGTPRVAGTAAARRQLAEDLRHAAEPLDPLAKAAEDLLVFPLGPAPHPTGDPVREIDEITERGVPANRPLTATPALQSTRGITTARTSSSTTFKFSAVVPRSVEARRYAPGETRGNSNDPSLETFDWSEPLTARRLWGVRVTAHPLPTCMVRGTAMRPATVRLLGRAIEKSSPESVVPSSTSIAVARSMVVAFG